MIILDLNIIETHNSKTIGIADSSTYDPNIIIANPTMEITPPGGYNRVSLPFQPKSINTYNSNLVGITNACDQDQLVNMPDGLYILRYSINPNLTTYVIKTFMRTTMIECRLQQSLLSALTDEKLTYTQKDNLRKKILDIQILIEGSISAANQLDTTTSVDLYNRADKLIANLNKQRCNNC